MTRLKVKCCDDRCLQVRSFKCFAAFDRKHAVRPRERLPRAGNKGPARRCFHGGDQFAGRHAQRAKAKQERGKPLATVHPSVHLHASAFARLSLTSCAVRSSFRGVTEMNFSFIAARSVPGLSSGGSRPKRSQKYGKPRPSARSSIHRPWTSLPWLVTTVPATSSGG